MTRPRQKIEEEIFAKCASELLKQEWFISEPNNEIDWPDLLIRNGNKEFGLEVRKVFNDEQLGGSPSRAGESKRRKILLRAASEYYKSNTRAIQVQLFGDPGDPTDLAQQISIAGKSLEVWGRKRVRLDDNRWMHVCRLPDECQKYSRWVLLSDKVGWVGTVNHCIVQHSINLKAENLFRYRKNLDQIHLLLVCDRMNNSGKNYFSEVGSLELAGFDCIYLLSYPDSIIKI